MDTDDQYEIVIRPLLESTDFTSIFQIVDVDKEEYGHPYEVNDIQRFVLSPYHTVVLAYHKEQVVGYMVYLLQVSKKASKFDIVSIVVRRAYRRRKIGSDLVGFLVTNLAQLGTSFSITAEVIEVDLRAQVFLRSLGFKWKKPIKSKNKVNNEDTYLMVAHVKPK